MMNWELPDGKFALKSLHNKLENIRYYTEKKKWEHIPVFYKNKHFTVRVERTKPVEGLDYNKLENIKYYTEQKKWESFPVFYKNTYFNIKVERVKPIEGLNYNKIHYIDIYINDELVCRLWSKDCTFSKYRWVETTNKRHSNEIFAIIKQANRVYKKMYKEDFNKAFSKIMDDRSYFKPKDIDN